MAKNKKLKMLKAVVICFVAVAIVAAIFTTALAFGDASEGYRTITVIEVQGTVGVVHNNVEYQAYKGMHLEEGYTVVTSGNSYVRMLLDDDKYVKLESGSKAIFEELSGDKTAIKIERGSLVSEITKPLKVNEDFIVNTPNAVLAVRGTLFRVDLSRNKKGELNTDIMTYGGAVSSKRIQPNGEVEAVEVTIKEGFKATVNMDEKETVYLVDDVKIDLSALVGESGGNANNNTIITETNASGEIISTAPITLESVLKPIVIEDIPDDDLVDIYFASENGHSMFVETEQIETHIEERNIDVTQKTSVYEIAEKIENPTEIVIPDDNVPIPTVTEPEKEVAQSVQGPPTDGVGEVHKHIAITQVLKPTCTKNGKITVNCSECGELISERPIAALGHVAVSTVTLQPTCNTKGTRTESCSVCGEVISVTELEATGHTTETVTVKPTCTIAGKTVVSCTVCGEKLSEVINPAVGHKEVPGGTGDSHSECETCGEILSTTHSFKEITVEPTCTTDGGKTYACDCGYTYEEVYSALGHTKTTKTVPATCTAEGSETTSCTVCKEVLEHKILEKLPHNEETTTVAATCTTDGSKTTKCTVCKKTLEEIILNAKGHTEVYVGTDAVHIRCSVCDLPLVTEHNMDKGKVTKNATCLTDGEMLYSCECGYSYTEPITAQGHVEVAGATADAHVKCDTCGAVISTEHNLQETVNVKEDCVTDGSYTYSCECGYSYSQTVSKTGHTSVAGNEADVHSKCSKCGETLEDGTYHSYTKAVTTPKSCTAAGVLTCTCECGWAYTEPIPAGHTKSEANASVTTCSVCGANWVDLNSTNFPDSMFLSYLNLTYNTDTIVNDEALIGIELTSVTQINLSGDSSTDGGYTDLTGIKYFGDLESVSCAYNSSITSLDLSGLTLLEHLDVTGLTGLKSLNISGCTALTVENITGLDTCTELTELNVSGCTNIGELNLNSNAKLETVNLSNCSALKSFVIDDAAKTYALKNINLTGCTALETLIINNALSLSSIDLADSAAIKEISLGGCQNVSGVLNLSNKSALTTLEISAAGFTSLNVTGCAALTEINALACSGLTTIAGIGDCSAVTTLMLKGTGLTSLDLNSTNPELQSLNTENCTSLINLDLTRSAESTTLKSLAVAGCTALKTLNLYNCKGITALDTSTLTALEELNLTYSGVTEFNNASDTMDFSPNVKLKGVYLNGVSSFAVFDVSANTLLEAFALSDNSNASAIDFSNNAKLKTLNLSDVPSLVTLDISACTELEGVSLLNTGLTTLSVTGSSALTQFWVYNNANLESLSLTGATELKNIKLSSGMENTALKNLAITNCGITSIDVAYLTALTSLNISGCTGITSLDFSSTSGLTALETLDVSNNGSLTYLNLSTLTSLKTITVINSGFMTHIDISNTQLTGIDTTGMYNIEEYVARDATKLTSVFVQNSGANLKKLDISGCTSLTDVNVSSNTGLTELNASGCTGITSLDVSKCTLLTKLNLSNTSITSIDVLDLTELTILDVSGTAIEMLDVSYCQVLESVDMSNCTSLTVFAMASGEPYSSFTSLNASGCTAITDLQIEACTSITTLDLSGLTSLRALYLNDCTGITTINVSNTDLTSLDIGECTAIESIDITGTSITVDRITLPDGVTPTITGP